MSVDAALYDVTVLSSRGAVTPIAAKFLSSASSMSKAGASQSASSHEKSRGTLRIRGLRAYYLYVRPSALISIRTIQQDESCGTTEGGQITRGATFQGW
jgi:hypothetical protein